MLMPAVPARPRRLLLAGLSLALLAASPARALQITAQLTDLDDGLGPGGDYWEASYQLSGHLFALDQSFTIYFAPGSYSDLGDPEPGVHAPGWDVLVAQPDELLPAAGFYDGLALLAGADLSLPFRVRFVWLGSGAPGVQAWELLQFDSSGVLIDLLERGATSLVPEPALPALLAAAAAALALCRRPRPRRG
jgi:hypothetical protein